MAQLLGDYRKRPANTGWQRRVLRTEFRGTTPLHSGGPNLISWHSHEIGVSILLMAKSGRWIHVHTYNDARVMIFSEGLALPSEENLNQPQGASPVVGGAGI